MTVFIAKMIEGVWPEAGGFSSPHLATRQLLWRISRAVPLPSIKREKLSLAFLIFAALAAIVYIIEINVILFEGKKISKFETVLEELGRDKILKETFLSGIRSPLSIKRQAMDAINMVEVTNINYLHEAESVASHIAP